MFKTFKINKKMDGLIKKKRKRWIGMEEIGHVGVTIKYSLLMYQFMFVWFN